MPALLVRLTSVLALSFLGGCGIDQGGVQVTQPAPPGALMIVGPITGFGSVHVNGLSLETAATEILVDGDPVPQSALKEGQIIRAVAAVTPFSINAVSIEYRENVRGPIEALDAAAGTLTVLGQQVQTNARTVLDIAAGGSLDDLALSERIEVSGFRLPTGAIQATYLGIAAPTAPLTATTAITSVDLNALTFELGALTVDYSQVLLLDVPMGMPDIGLVVEVEGTALSADGALIVTEIRSLPAAPGVFVASDTAPASFAAVGSGRSTTLRANIFSVITATDLPSSITIGDVTVLINTLTQIDNGSIDNLTPGRLVQVEGDVVSFGLIQADRIELF